jgi:hypothetical protein
MISEELRGWLNAMAPYLAIGVSVWLAFRIKAVHQLVNSQMDAFRAALQKLADEQAAGIYQAGQQNIRDTQKGVTVAAAHATESAAVATTEAARATTAAAEALSSTIPPGPMP